MSGSSLRSHPQLMLRHESGLRSVVRSLLRDDTRVDDVLQETWLRAWESPPRSEAALGSWLRRVATRNAHASRRRDRARTTYESEVLPPEPAPATVELVAVDARDQELRRAVHALHEPYRGAIRQRFFAHRTPDEIADHDNVPIETVRTRIKRGLARLRSTLTESIVD